MATRVAHPQLYSFSHMWPCIDRDDTRFTVAIKEEHNISGDLNNLEAGMKKAAGGAVEKTTRLRIDVFRFRRIVDMSFQILLLGGSPWLVGNLAIGRIHHPACLRNSWSSGTDSKQFVEASTPGPRICNVKSAGRNGSPESLQVGLTVGRVRRGPVVVGSCLCLIFLLRWLVLSKSWHRRERKDNE